MDKKTKSILFLLLSGVLMSALDISVIGPVLPKIQSIYGLDTRGASWLINIYVLFMMQNDLLYSAPKDNSAFSIFCFL